MYTSALFLSYLLWGKLIYEKLSSLTLMLLYK